MFDPEKFDAVVEVDEVGMVEADDVANEVVADTEGSGAAAAAVVGFADEALVDFDAPWLLLVVPFSSSPDIRAALRFVDPAQCSGLTHRRTNISCAALSKARTPVRSTSSIANRSCNDVSSSLGFVNPCLHYLTLSE